jgi:hypothetical protein
LHLDLRGGVSQLEPEAQPVAGEEVETAAPAVAGDVSANLASADSSDSRQAAEEESGPVRRDDLPEYDFRTVSTGGAGQ